MSADKKKLSVSPTVNSAYKRRDQRCEDVPAAGMSLSTSRRHFDLARKSLGGATRTSAQTQVLVESVETAVIDKQLEPIDKQLEPIGKVLEP